MCCIASALQTGKALRSKGLRLPQGGIMRSQKHLTLQRLSPQAQPPASACMSTL